MKEIVLFGGGGHCYTSIALINSLGEYLPKVIFDDAPKGKDILGVALKTYLNEKFTSKALAITIGNNKVRRTKALTFSDAYFPSFSHKSAVIYPSVSIGKGTLVLPNAVLDASSNIGDFCIINNNATVSHNATLGDFVHAAINVAIAGGVTVGEGTLLGVGCIILPEVTIGKWVIIGAGAVVTKDIPDFAVVYGNPARIIKYNHSHEN